MGTKHKHAEVIKAWADGEEVEYRTFQGDWTLLDIPSPTWSYREYRVKTKSPIILYRSIRLSRDNNTICLSHADGASTADLVFKFDPKDLFFISVEMIK